MTLVYGEGVMDRILGVLYLNADVELVGWGVQRIDLHENELPAELIVSSVAQQLCDPVSLGHQVVLIVVGALYQQPVLTFCVDEAGDLGHRFQYTVCFGSGEACFPVRYS